MLYTTLIFLVPTPFSKLSLLGEEKIRDSWEEKDVMEKGVGWSWKEKSPFQSGRAGSKTAVRRKRRVVRGLEQRQRVERQTATSGENRRNKRQQSVSAETRRHPALLQSSPKALLHDAPSRAQVLNSPPSGLDSGRKADHLTLAGLADPELPCWSAVPATWGGGVTLLLADVFDWSEGGVLGCPPAGPLPTKAGPEGSQLEREEPGRYSWKGAGPRARSKPRRAGGALGCHKVNGRRRGVALLCEAHSLIC